MISIDRTPGKPVQAQVADQLRYLIATGKYPVGARLPATRGLAEQLGISYHTVRAAYGTLQAEGLIRGRGGSGFRVVERPSAPRSERMEQGAAVIQESLRRLIGLGLEFEEIEYLFQEQSEEILTGHQEYKLVFVAPAMELAEACAEQVSAALQQPVEAATLETLERHADADVVLAPYDFVRRVMAGGSRADVRGLVVHLNASALDRVARLLDDDTLGIVTRREEAVGPLVHAIRAEAGFRGQMIGFSADRDKKELGQLIEQATLIVHTPQSRRALLPYFQNDVAHAVVQPVLSEDSLESLRQSLPA